MSNSFLEVFRMDWCCVQKYHMILTGSWGSADLERHLRLTLISGCYSSLWEEKSQGEIKQDRLARNQSQSQWGRGKNETPRSMWAKSGREQKHRGLVSVGVQSTWVYSHPTQLLIRRKGPSWDHLDGVLLQSSATKHKHTQTIRKQLSLGKLFLVRHFDDQIYAYRQTSKHRHTHARTHLTTLWKQRGQKIIITSAQLQLSAYQCRSAEGHC